MIVREQIVREQGAGSREGKGQQEETIEKAPFVRILVDLPKKNSIEF